MRKISKVKVILLIIILIILASLIRSLAVSIYTDGNGYFHSDDFPGVPFFCVQSGNPTPSGVLVQKGHTDIHYNKVCHYDNNNQLKEEWAFGLTYPSAEREYQMNGFSILSWVAQGGIDPSNHYYYGHKSERQIAVYQNCLRAVRGGSAACGERWN